MATNEYGLDVDYFQKWLARLQDISRFTPDELARELARMARAADSSVLNEKEFRQVDESLHLDGARHNLENTMLLSEYLSCFDSELIESDEMEFIGENEDGLEGVFTENITQISHDAWVYLSHLTGSANHKVKSNDPT